MLFDSSQMAHRKLNWLLLTFNTDKGDAHWQSFKKNKWIKTTGEGGKKKTFTARSENGCTSTDRHPTGWSLRDAEKLVASDSKGLWDCHCCRRCSNKVWSKKCASWSSRAFEGILKEIHPSTCFLRHLSLFGSRVSRSQSQLSEAEWHWTTIHSQWMEFKSMSQRRRRQLIKRIIDLVTYFLRCKCGRILWSWMLQ